MKWIFWVSAVFIVYVYVGYPFWLYLRSRWQPRPWRQEEIFPPVSVVLAVHDGEHWVKQKLHNLYTLDYPTDRLEIIVVSDGSRDKTNSLLAQHANERLRFFQYPEHRGKTAALNWGMKQARGEVVVFTDIRQQLEPESVRFLVSNFADPIVGCVAGELLLRDENSEATGGGVRLYWRYEKWIRKSESKIDSTMGTSGALYAVRRRLLTLLPEGTILDDVYLPMHVIRQGYRSVFDSRARAWDSVSLNSRGEFRRKVRTLAGNYQLLQLAPWLLSCENRLRFQFVSHKLLRLFVPLFLLSLLSSSWLLTAEFFYLCAALLQSAFYLCAIVGLGWRARSFGTVLGAPAAFCLLNGAAAVGLLAFLFRRGPLWQVWFPSLPERSGSSKKRGKKISCQV